MIDFEQEIETRLRLFQYLNGKGNVKDCNRELYQIVRLMLGMISQNNNATLLPFTPQFMRAEAPDASPSREAPMSYQIQTPTLTPAPEPFIAASDYEGDDDADDDDEVITVTPEALSLSTAPQTIDAPYGYTRAGHVRLTPPTHGLLPNGQARYPQKKKR